MDVTLRLVKAVYEHGHKFGHKDSKKLDFKKVIDY